MTNKDRELAQTHRLLAMEYAVQIMKHDGLGFYFGMFLYGLPYYYNVLSANYHSKRSKRIINKP